MKNPQNLFTARKNQSFFHSDISQILLNCGFLIYERIWNSSGLPMHLLTGFLKSFPISPWGGFLIPYIVQHWLNSCFSRETLSQSGTFLIVLLTRKVSTTLSGYKCLSGVLSRETMRISLLCFEDNSYGFFSEAYPTLLS